MNLEFKFTAIESLLILKGLSLLAKDTECHELDRKGAWKLREKLLKEMKHEDQNM